MVSSLASYTSKHTERQMTVTPKITFMGSGGTETRYFQRKLEFKNFDVNNTSSHILCIERK